MKTSKWKTFLGVILLAFSILSYIIHFLIFKDAHHIFLFMLGDISFLPIEVLLVTMVLHRLLDKREKKMILQKRNILIGVFFSEIGKKLLDICINCDYESTKMKNEIIIKHDSNEEVFKAIIKKINNFRFIIDIDLLHLKELKSLLDAKRSFMIKILESPILLEHETFTDLLSAVFHLEEELIIRDDIKSINAIDKEHIQNDIKRVYEVLIVEWILYMTYLQKEYPYLYSYAVRTNPLNRVSETEVE